MAHQWVVTGTTTRGGQPRGWHLHAIEADPEESFEDIKSRKSLCGVRSRNGWALDLHITKKCARCLVASGRACETCRGTGRGEASSPCMTCLTTGERSAAASG